MKNATILTLVSKNCSEGDLRGMIENARAEDAHLAVLVLGAAPQLPLYSYGVSPYSPAIFPEDWPERFLAESEAVSKKAKELETLLQNESISGDVTVVNCEASQIPDAVARRAMVSDLCILTPELCAAGNVFDPAVFGVLFGSPIAIVVNGAQNGSAIKPKRVFVAWNAGLPSARAVQQAMPMLRQAQQVTIGIIDPVMTEDRDGENPGSDLAKWLSQHGCKVEVSQYPSGGKEIGDCIIGRAKETGADLVVMGAYGHSKFREGIFGGTTRTLIKQQDLAVLLAH